MTTRRAPRNLCLGLLDRASASEWAGYDPYDALNSRVLNRLGMLRNRYLRLAWTQACKLLPFNPRAALAVPRTVNPKLLALFLDGMLDLNQGSTVSGPSARSLADRLIERRARAYAGFSWGYPFAWQARAFYLPVGTPTVVATSYAGHALLNAYLHFGDSQYLEAARGACEFILTDLNRTETPDGLCFSYSPLDETRVHNASVLGARLLSRVGTVTSESELVDTAERAASYCVSRQSENGFWPYGEAAYQSWVDNFHTGYILECLFDLADAIEAPRLDDALARGLSAYREGLFAWDGTPRYYAHRAMPKDVHCYAQGILTFCRVGGEEGRRFAARIARCAMRDLRHPSGYFCYRRYRVLRNQVDYARWSQAWMFRGLASYARAVEEI